MGFRLSSKAKDVIKVVAPTLGAALGGPLGGLAGQVIGGIVGGGKPGDLEEALISQKPETLLALKQAENDFKLKLREMDIDEEQVYAADRASARELAKVDMGPHKLLSLTFIGGYFMILAAFFVGKFEIDPSLKEPFLILIGVITANVPSIMQFWFGTSSGSQRKTDILAEKASAAR
jgi:hypothetical protein